MEDQSEANDNVLNDPRVIEAIAQAHSRGITEGYSEGIRAARQHMSGLTEFRPSPEPLSNLPAPATQALSSHTLHSMNDRVVNLLLRNGVTTIADAIENWEKLGDLPQFGGVAYRKLKESLFKNGYQTPEIPRAWLH